jgi:uracil-DNA glycosylase
MTQKRLEAFFKSTAPAKDNTHNKRTKVDARATTGCSPNDPGKKVQMRSMANKNVALAKQAVIACERQGQVPYLKDLMIEQSWKDALASEFEKPYFKHLEEFVRSEWCSGNLVFPPKDSVFRAYNSVPLNDVKVVILGQDPYHDIGQAQGLSFSVPTGKKLPSSLKNIYKEITEDMGYRMPTEKGRENGCLEPWAHQGVLMLNSVLTVQAHKAASHSKKGWEEFTTHTVRVINKELSGVVFLLWGKYAQDKGSLIDTKRHHVLTCPHPSGLSAHRGFFGCRHFSKANELLVDQGSDAIDWRID